MDFKNIKVFVADVDGTLRSRNKMYPGEITTSAFEQMHKDGYILGIASGRPLWQHVKDHYKEWGLSFQFDFLMGMNGGEIWTKKTNETKQYKPLSCEQLKKIVLNLNKEKGTDPFVYREGMELARFVNDEMIASGKRHDTIIQSVKDETELYSEPTAKILYRCDSADIALHIEEIGRKIDPQIACFRTGPELVEFQNKDISKGSGITTYCKDNGFTLDEVIGFGDAENDIEMLKVVGWSVALKDGMEEAKKVADDITLFDAGDDGVGHYLWDHILNK